MSRKDFPTWIFFLFWELITIVTGIGVGVSKGSFGLFIVWIILFSYIGLMLALQEVFFGAKKDGGNHSGE